MLANKQVGHRILNDSSINEVNELLNCCCCILYTVLRIIGCVDGGTQIISVINRIEILCSCFRLLLVRTLFNREQNVLRRITIWKKKILLIDYNLMNLILDIKAN